MTDLVMHRRVRQAVIGGEVLVLGGQLLLQLHLLPPNMLKRAHRHRRASLHLRPKTPPAHPRRDTSSANSHGDQFRHHMLQIPEAFEFMQRKAQIGYLYRNLLRREGSTAFYNKFRLFSLEQIQTFPVIWSNICGILN